MKWQGLDTIVQLTEEGEARAHRYYYTYRVAGTYWVAGRYWFSREVDYRIKFETAELAREYCEMKDREAVIIEAQV